MKKVIKLTEDDLIRIVKRVINEQDSVKEGKLDDDLSELEKYNKESYLRKKLRENTETKSNYQQIIDNFKSLLPDEYHNKVDEVFDHIKNYIESEGFTIKVLNGCSVPFRGVRTNNFIIICSPQSLKSLADLVYILFHEIRHEIQVSRMNKPDSLINDYDDIEELFEIYWEMELDAHDYGLEWVNKIDKIIGLPKDLYQLSKNIIDYPTAGRTIKFQIEQLHKIVKDLKKKGHEVNDILDLPIVKNYVDRLESLF